MSSSPSDDVLARARRVIEEAQALRRELAEVRDQVRLERLERELAEVEKKLALIIGTESAQAPEPESKNR